MLAVPRLSVLPRTQYKREAAAPLSGRQLPRSVATTKLDRQHTAMLTLGSGTGRLKKSEGL